MKINPGKSKAVGFTKSWAKERIRYYFGDQLMAETSSFKYLEIIIRSELNWQIVSVIQYEKQGMHFIS